MKFRSILTTFALAGVLGLGFMAGLSAGNEKVEEAKADNVRVYLILNDNLRNHWNSKGGTYYCDYTYSGGSTSTTLSDMNGLTYVDLPSDTTSFNFNVNHWGGDTSTVSLSLQNDGNNTYKVTTCNYETYNQSGYWMKVSDAAMENTTVYFVDGFNWSHDGNKVYAHYWGGSEAGSTWRGLEMTYTGIRLRYYKNYGQDQYNSPVFKAVIPNGRLVIFNANDGQTDQCAIFANTYYYYGIDQFNKYIPVLDFAFGIKSHLGNATVKGVEFDNSICAIEQGDAVTLASEYVDLLSRQDTDIGNSAKWTTLNTYSSDPNEYLNKDIRDVNLELIMDRLAIMYPSLVISPSGAFVMNAQSETNYTAAIIIIFALALTAVGGYFLLRRKER